MGKQNRFNYADETDRWGNILHIPTGETRYHPNAKPYKHRPTIYYGTYCGRNAPPLYIIHNDDHEVSSIDRQYEKTLCKACLEAYKAKWKKDYQR